MKVLARLVDVIAYSTSETDENGNVNMVLYLRGSKELEAGSRNKYMSAKIPFTYKALLEDMQQAIDRLEKEDGAVVTDKPIEVYKDQSEVADFKETVSFKINKFVDEYSTKYDKSPVVEEIAKALNDQGMMDKYQAITNKHLGKGKLVRDCDATQIDLLMLILDDLNDLVKEEGLLIE